MWITFHVRQSLKPQLITFSNIQPQFAIKVYQVDLETRIYQTHTNIICDQYVSQYL